MPEIGTSGLMSGDGKRAALSFRTRAHPRLYRRLHWLSSIMADSTAPRNISAQSRANSFVESLWSVSFLREIHPKSFGRRARDYFMQP